MLPQARPLLRRFTMLLAKAKNFSLKCTWSHLHVEAPLTLTTSTATMFVVSGAA
jgi:hypothetical protein